jgi:DNA-directed RNA polymerase I, II, and III subunit RPABC1
MDGEKYSASLIRLWRVWRTTKEMMNDRVGCAVTNA